METISKKELQQRGQPDFDALFRDVIYSITKYVHDEATRNKRYVKIGLGWWYNNPKRDFFEITKKILNYFNHDGKISHIFEEMKRIYFDSKITMTTETHKDKETLFEDCVCIDWS